MRSVPLTFTLMVYALPEVVGTANVAPLLMSNSAIVSDIGLVAEPGVPDVPDNNTLAPASDLPSCANASACVNR